jgi:hypothetical protein
VRNSKTSGDEITPAPAKPLGRNRFRVNVRGSEHARIQRQKYGYFSVGWETAANDCEHRFGGEGVSQSPLKDQAFSTFLDQNPPFELPAENGISSSTKACPVQWTVIDNSATKRLAKGKLPSHRSA